MKITTKTTKEQLVKAIGANISQIDKKGHKDLYDRLAYTDKVYRKDSSNVTKADLVTLVKDMMKALGDRFKEPAVQLAPANSLKKSKKAEPKEETPQTEETSETPKKKVTKKKGTPKKSEDSAVNSLEVDLADVFKEEITIEDGDSKVSLKIAHDIKDMKSLVKALENNETIVFAMYWSERLLAQFPYFNGDFKAPAKFPMDLDLSTCLYASDNGTCAYAISSFTEGMYLILPEHLKEYNGLRFSNGIEYQIYREVETDEE